MNYENYQNAPVFDKDGDKIGTIADMYYTDNQDQPMWATIKSGLFGTRKHFIPLADVFETTEGIVLHTIDEATVKDAPSIENDDELTEDDAMRLANYYRYQDEKEYGRELDPRANEPMPHVDFEVSTEQESILSSGRQTLHRYIVREGHKQWQEEVFIERTPLEE